MGSKVRIPKLTHHNYSLCSLIKSPFSSLLSFSSSHWTFSRPTWVHLSLCNKDFIIGVLWPPSWQDWLHLAHCLWGLLVNTSFYWWFSLSPFTKGLCSTWTAIGDWHTHLLFLISPCPCLMDPPYPFSSPIGCTPASTENRWEWMLPHMEGFSDSLSQSFLLWEQNFPFSGTSKVKGGVDDLNQTPSGLQDIKHFSLCTCVSGKRRQLSGPAHFCSTAKFGRVSSLNVMLTNNQLCLLEICVVQVYRHCKHRLQWIYKWMK